MAIQDNSPNKKCIRWSNIQILNKGNVYSVRDGNTNQKYVYWSNDNPTTFQFSKTFPVEYDEIVFLNNEGMSTIYPSMNIIIDGNAIYDKNTTLTEHISNIDTHFLPKEKQAFHSLGELSNKNNALIMALGESYTQLEKRVILLEKKLEEV